MKVFKKTNDFQARGGVGAAGHSKSIDSLIQTFQKTHDVDKEVREGANVPIFLRGKEPREQER